MIETAKESKSETNLNKTLGRWHRCRWQMLVKLSVGGHFFSLVTETLFVQINSTIFPLHLMTFLKTRSASREKPVPGGRILNSSSKTFSKTPFRRIPSPGHRSISTFGFSRLDQAWTQSHWQCQFDTDKPHRGLYILVTVTVKCRIIRQDP